MFAMRLSELHMSVENGWLAKSHICCCGFGFSRTRYVALADLTFSLAYSPHAATKTRDGAMQTQPQLHTEPKRGRTYF